MSFFPLPIKQTELEEKMVEQLKLISLKLNCLQQDELTVDDLEE